MNKVPLEKTILQVKALFSAFGATTQLLAQAFTPPPFERVLSAIKALYEMGVIVSNDEHDAATRLGSIGTHLPMDLGLVKLILLGHSFGCVVEAIVMASALSLQVQSVAIIKNQSIKKFYKMLL